MDEPKSTESSKTTYIIVVYKKMSTGLEAYGLRRRETGWGASKRGSWGNDYALPGHEFESLAEARRVFVRLEHVRKGRRAVIMERTCIARETYTVVRACGDVVQSIGALAVEPVRP